MKKLSTLVVLLLSVISYSSTAAPTDDDRRGYSNSFIFQEGGIEFAVFPDGQFDFNYLDEVAQVNFQINTPNASLSFNSGYDYDPYVQYDTYGAVIQIENTPVFYDGYGRIIQAGNVFIDYRNGFVNRVGNLYVTYNRPGVIFRTRGFINSFNRFYVYQPWHAYYGVPLVNNCIVWNNPYRLYYNPIRYDWSYHRVNWNRPYYYNGCYSAVNLRRTFYRPNDRVVYNSYEQGRRDTRGRLVVDRNTNNYRNEVATGRREMTRSSSEYTSTGRGSNSRNSNAAMATSGRSSDLRNTNNRGSINTSIAAPDNATRSNRGNSVNSNESTSRSNRSTYNTGRTASVEREPATTSRSSRTVTNRENTTMQPQRTSRTVNTTPRQTAPAVSNTQRTSRSATVAPTRENTAVRTNAPSRSSHATTTAPSRQSAPVRATSTQRSSAPAAARKTSSSTSRSSSRSNGRSGN